MDHPASATAPVESGDGLRALFEGGPLHGRVLPVPAVGVPLDFYPGDPDGRDHLAPGAWVEAALEPDEPRGRYVENDRHEGAPVRMVWVEGVGPERMRENED